MILIKGSKTLPLNSSIRFHIRSCLVSPVFGRAGLLVGSIPVPAADEEDVDDDDDTVNEENTHTKQKPNSFNNSEGTTGNADGARKHGVNPEELD